MIHSLRFQIPLAVLVIALAIVAGTFQVSVTQTDRLLSQTLVEQGSTMAQRWAGDIAAALRENRVEIARSRVVRLASAPSVSGAILFNDQDNALYASPFVYEGASAAEIAPDLPGILQQVHRQHMSVIRSDDHTSIFTIAVPLQLQPLQGELVASRKGVLVIRFDFSRAHRAFQISGYKRGGVVIMLVLVACFLLALGIDRWVGKPAQLLKTRAETIAAGARTQEQPLLFDIDPQRLFLPGPNVEPPPERQAVNELVSLEQSFETMALEIESRTARMRLDSILINRIDQAVMLCAPDRTIVFANDACRRMLGYGLDELLGIDIQRFSPLPKESLGRVAADISQHLQQGQVWQDELPFVRKDGAVLATRTRVENIVLGNQTYMLVTRVDITREKEAERDRRIVEERFRTYITQMPAAVSLRDLAGNYILVNRVFAEWLNIDEEGVTGRPPEEILKPELASLQRELQEIVRTSGSSATREIELETGDTRRAVLHHEFPILQEGQLSGFGCIATDISALRQAERALRESQKLEAVGQLTGGIAHDFNNLMMVILGNLELLRDSVNADDRVMIDEAISACRNGADLTQRLLTFARQTHLHAAATDLNQLINGMYSLLTRSLGERYPISVSDLADGLWQVSVDRHQMENAILNLSINARDAMPDGGTLRLQTTNRHLAAPEQVTTGLLEAGSYVVLSVIDTGAGIHPEQFPRLFEPFYTTKAVGQGTGLGLSMVYGFMKDSGGQINVVSKPGDGTRIDLYLPRTATARQTTNETRPSDSRPDQAVDTSSVRILLVEDDPALRRLVRRKLDALNCQVAEAGAAEEALRHIERADFDLLLSDMILPGSTTGVDIAKAAYARNPSIRIVFMSGYDFGRLDETEFDYQYLKKPFSVADLSDIVRDVLA